MVKVDVGWGTSCTYWNSAAGGAENICRKILVEPPGVRSRLLCFQPSFLLTCLEKQLWMAPALGALVIMQGNSEGAPGSRLGLA